MFEELNAAPSREKKRSPCCSTKTACSKKPRKPVATNGTNSIAGWKKSSAESTAAMSRAAILRNDSAPNGSTRESLEAEIEIERKAWKAWREAAENELVHLRTRSADSLKSAPIPPDLRALAEENQRLRQESLALRQSTGGPEVELLRARLDAARADFAELERKLQLAQDQRERELKEHEVELAALRSRSARDAAERKAASAGNAGDEKELSPDERIRAFREHLRELHVDESKQKVKRGLSNRLSRLWNRTAPGS